MGTGVEVLRVTSESDMGREEWQVTVVRTGGLVVRAPRAADLPADIREGLRDWLDEADAAPEFDWNAHDHGERTPCVKGMCPGYPNGSLGE